MIDFSCEILYNKRVETRRLPQHTYTFEPRGCALNSRAVCCSRRLILVITQPHRNAAKSIKWHFRQSFGIVFFYARKEAIMDTNQIVQLIVAILTGLATCIPLAVKLVEYVKTATKEKNWANLLGLVMSLMEQAEKKFDDGATRKEWVMAMVKASADYINYPVDEDTLSKMIDSLCDMSKVVNGTNTNQTITTEQTLKSPGVSGAMFYGGKNLEVPTE